MIDFRSDTLTQPTPGMRKAMAEAVVGDEQKREDPTVIALEERGAEAGNSATISAMVHTISLSREGRVKLERVDVAHESGFGLVNPLSVKKQIEGQITWFYNDAMHQACNIENGAIAR